MQIKWNITSHYHFLKQPKHGKGLGETGTLHIFGRMAKDCSHIKDTQESEQQSCYDLAISSLDIYLKELK